ncbi:MAG TPA: saccharopine dehydrogenase C-terminal domain-containing protein [Beijerinckiaceae bacterium]|nr:saccharopine dehydrogenase C-terminal domain-containing protein [Beijerinckiaceae bacterium]
MRIGILGAGKIGRTLRDMLGSVPGVNGATLADLGPGAEVVLDVRDAEALSRFTREHDAIVSALPFTLNRDVAGICAREGRSYFDFTEDTATTRHVKALAAESRKAVFVPQCGLAPGAVNIIGASLIDPFEQVKSLELRVGALPLSANNEMKYYLSWSSAGLINEYLQPCDALYRGEPVKMLPLDGLEQIVIDGVAYEAFNTSGGVATMCETFAGRVDELNYKTIRYPGHRDHLRFVIKDLGLGDRPDLLTEILDQAVPETGQDLVLIYVNAVGLTQGRPQQVSYVKKVRAQEGYPATAIQTTTAAGMAAVVEMWAAGKFAPGFVRQEQIRLDDFLATTWGGRIYG